MSLKKIGIGAFVVTSVIVAFFFIQTSFAASNQKEVNCGTKWTKIYEGKINGEEKTGDLGWELKHGKALSYSKLDSLINSGCNFQVVKTIGTEGQVRESFTCSFVSLSFGGYFQCLSSKYSWDGTEESQAYRGMLLEFGSEQVGPGDFNFNGKLYYHTYGNELVDPTEQYISLKIYSRG